MIKYSNEVSNKIKELEPLWEPLLERINGGNLVLGRGKVLPLSMRTGNIERWLKMAEGGMLYLAREIQDVVMYLESWIQVAEEEKLRLYVEGFDNIEQAVKRDTKKLCGLYNIISNEIESKEDMTITQTKPNKYFDDLGK